jgi:hypothetical protein
MGLFASCLAALVASLASFIRDVNLSLEALRLEVQAAEDGATDGENPLDG